jgi:hypothetical protein
LSPPRQLFLAMSSADVNRASLHEPKLIATLTSLANDFRATAMRIVAYLCGVAVLALAATDIASRLQDDIDLSPRLPLRQSAWYPVERPIPAFSASLPDLGDKTTAYEILRHGEGGRKDVLKWSDAGVALPWVEIEIYRPGAESPGFAPASLEIGARTALWNVRDVQADGMIDSKFGPVSLVAFSAQTAGKRLSCTGFARSFDDPPVQISGWTCGGAAQPSGRHAAACLLNRLTLLAASDPKLAELFARSELKRQPDCGSAALTSESWLTTLDEPELRGAVATN